MTQQEEFVEQNDESEEAPFYAYMIFQYDVDYYYVGTVDINQINKNIYAFNIIYPISAYLSNGLYVFTTLNGMGDTAYELNLNKSRVIAIFTPSEKVVEQYESIINKLHKNIPDLNDDNEEDTTDHMNFYEVKTIQ